MLWDAENKFSTHQAVAATAVSENVVKVPVGDIGKGRSAVLQISGAPYTGTGIISVEVQTADNEAMTGAKVIGTVNIGNDRLTKGGSLSVSTIPTGAQEFLRLNYVVSGALAGGNISAGLVLGGDTGSM